MSVKGAESTTRVHHNAGSLADPATGTSCRGRLEEVATSVVAAAAGDDALCRLRGAVICWSPVAGLEISPAKVLNISTP